MTNSRLKVCGWVSALVPTPKIASGNPLKDGIGHIIWWLIYKTVLDIHKGDHSHSTYIFAISMTK